MRIHTHFRKAVAALFGETPLGIIGAGLQWLTIAILLAICFRGIPLSWHLAVTWTGVAALLAGIALAFRGKSLGPIIVIPSVIGIAMILLLAAICYPLTLLTRDEGREADHSTKEEH